MKKMDNIDNDGKEIEGKVRDAAAILLKETKGMLVRLHDTKSASRYLPPVAGDFMGTIGGRPILIECKSSVEGRSLVDYRVDDFMRATQVGSMVMWEKVGATYLLLFYSYIESKTEFYLGWQIDRASRGCGLKKPVVELDGFNPKDIAKVLCELVENIKRGNHQI